MTHLAHRFSRGVRIGALCIAAALAAALTASVSSVAAAPSKQSSFTPVEQLVASHGRLTSQSLTVTTDDGQLHGRTTGPVDQWLGIPYARPPVGALRWEPPQPAASWTGVRECDQSYGNECTQLGNPTVNTEDCLYLNVFAPAVIPADAKLPVLFWIHGGGSVSGSGDQYDGSLLAQSDGIIVVTINYRLGPFGILDLPGLSSAEPTGNFSLLDMEAALRWTQSNIAAFGGDPSKVTIAGESAGGMAVCSLLASPPAKGLFSAAIMESGSCRGNSEATAEAEALAVAKAAGCPTAATAAACLRGKNEATVLSASASFIPVWYTYGGPDLPVSPLQAIESGHYNRVPILMGDNRDEGRAFSAGYAGYTSQQYTQLVDSAFGAGCGAVFGLNRLPVRLPAWRGQLACRARVAGPRPVPVLGVPHAGHGRLRDRSAHHRQLAVRRDRRLRRAGGRDVPGQVDHAVLLPVRRPESSLRRTAAFPASSPARTTAANSRSCGRASATGTRWQPSSPPPSRSSPARWSPTGGSSRRQAHQTPPANPAGRPTRPAQQGTRG